MSALYRHKSGSQKRKLKLEKEEKTFTNTQVISTFFKPKVSEKNTDFEETISHKNKTLEINIPEQSSNISKTEIHEHHEFEKASSLHEINNINFTDPGLWPQQMNDDIRQLIITANPSNFDNLLRIKKNYI